jgi:hypothetical protein
MAINPPTVAYLQSQGVPGFYVTCSNPMCLHSTPVPFKTLGLDPSTPLPAIEKIHRFVCSACGSPQSLTMPERQARRTAALRR